MIDGMWQTSGATSCQDTYHGTYTTAVLWVVGAGTDKEQMFPWSSKSDAKTLALDEDLSIDQLPAAQLCHESVVAALGA